MLSNVKPGEGKVHVTKGDWLDGSFQSYLLRVGYSGEDLPRTPSP